MPFIQKNDVHTIIYECLKNVCIITNSFGNDKALPKLYIVGTLIKHLSK